MTNGPYKIEQRGIPMDGMKKVPNDTRKRFPGYFGFGVFVAMAGIIGLVYIEDGRQDLVRAADAYGTAVAEECLASGGECIDVCERSVLEYDGPAGTYGRVVDTCWTRLTQDGS